MTDAEHVSTTRAAYDATAALYAEQIGTEISAHVEAPLDRALLAAFVEQVAAGPTGPVADVGCGPGRVAAFLTARGLDVVGVDLSPAMVATARAAHPGIRFEEGLLTDLPVTDGALVGAVCWYSIIHTPPEELAHVGTELARAIAPGGQLLVAFQAGAGEAVRREHVGGRAVGLTSYRHDPAEVASHLAAAGFEVRARSTREAELPHESTPQAFVSARRAGA